MLKKIIVVILICIFSYTYNINTVFADEEDLEEIDEEEVNELVVETAGTIIDEPVLNAKSAIIYDRKTKEVIWGKNENEKRKMASTTKIMTALIVLDNCKLDDVVTISKKAAGTGGSKLKIKEGDKISVNDLLYGLMLRSGNDTAVALAEYTAGSIEEFANLMNEKAKEIGLKNTNFVTPHGLDNEDHYTTAYELALLTDYALNNKKFAEIVNTKNITINVDGIPRTIGNTNELLGNLTGVNGVKTGFTNGAGRCLVTSCQRDENDIITVVLGCDTKKQRTSDSVKLIEYAFNNYTRIDLEQKINEEFENWNDINKNRIYINKAEKQEMILELGKINKKQIPIKKDEEKDIRLNFNIIYNYEAPVEKGTKVGNIIVKKRDEIIEIVDIIVSKEVKKKNIVSYFKELLTFYNKFGIIDMR